MRTLSPASVPLLPSRHPLSPTPAKTGQEEGDGALPPVRTGWGSGSGLSVSFRDCEVVQMGLTFQGLTGHRGDPCASPVWALAVSSGQCCLFHLLRCLLTFNCLSPVAHTGQPRVPVSSSHHPFSCPLLLGMCSVAPRRPASPSLFPLHTRVSMSHGMWPSLCAKVGIHITVGADAMSHQHHALSWLCWNTQVQVVLWASG